MSGMAARTVAAPPDGLVVAPVTPEDPWAAVHSIRREMRKARRDGITPSARFMLGIGSDGAEACLPDAAVLVLAYRS